MALLAALVLVACARATPTTRPTPWAYKGTVGLAAYPDIATVVVGEVLEMSGEEVLPLRDSPDSAHYGYWRLKVEQYLVDPFPYSELKIKQLLELIRPDGSTAPVLYPTYVRLAPGERAVFYLGRRSLPIEEPPVTGDTFTLTVGGSECGSSVIMAHLNVSVKLSPYEEGDSFIEQQGTTTIDDPEPGTGRGVDRRGSSRLDERLRAPDATIDGSVSEGGSRCPGAWEPRTPTCPRPCRSGEGAGGRSRPDDVRRVQLRPSSRPLGRA